MTTGCYCRLAVLAQARELRSALTKSKRRVAVTQLGGYVPEQTLTKNDLQPQCPEWLYCQQHHVHYGKSGATAVLRVTVSDPANPAQFNYFGQKANPPALQGGVRGGDSGGPLYWRPNGTPDQCSLGQLVLIGELFGGSAPTGGVDDAYGDLNAWTPLNLFTAWLAQNSPLRFVTAIPGNFNWSNPAALNDIVLGQTGFAPNNTIVYDQAAGTDFTQNFARYYQVTLSNAGTITLDMNLRRSTH